MTELEPSSSQLELVERGRDMARNIQGNLGRCLYRRKDAAELQDASDLLWGLANVLEDYIEAADYWRRMYEETVRERTCTMQLTDLERLARDLYALLTAPVPYTPAEMASRIAAMDYAKLRMSELGLEVTS